ncbi:META domain-containing protein [Dokdonia sp.]|uniref:META domain-containing protein n=1 Tax=Dokdonia sp. TaxID=2024995 RepID=UPI00326669FA
MIRFYILLFMMCLTNSCASKQETSSQPDENQIFAGTFVVNTLYGRLIEGDDIIMKINDRTSKVSGLAACNTYNVAFTQKQEKITFSHVVSTMVICDDETMKKERRFLNIFTGIKEFNTKGDTLILYNEGKEILKATRFIF